MKEEVTRHRKRLNRFSLWERIRRGLISVLCTKRSSKHSRPLPLVRECQECQECQEEKKDEETVKMNKSKAEPVSSWCHSCQAGSIKLHQRAVWSLTILVSGVYLMKAEMQEDQAREVHPDRQDGLQRMRKEMMSWENWCRKPERNQNSQGKDPRTFEENRQGKTVKVSTYQINSQRKDPRVLEAPV